MVPFIKFKISAIRDCATGCNLVIAECSPMYPKALKAFSGFGGEGLGFGGLKDLLLPGGSRSLRVTAI